MPQALPAIGAFVVKVATSKAIAAVLLRTVLVNYALGRLSRALSGKRTGEGAINTMKVMVRQTIAPREIVYGQVKKSGAVMFFGASGSSNQYLWYVVALAGHQCEAITDVWIDSEQIPDADINSSTGEVSTSKFAGKLKIWRHLGTYGQTVNADLDAAFSAWTSSHRLRGIAYLVIRMERDDKAFQGGPPSAFFALVKGKRVYDPRLDSTNGGSGSHRYTDATTWAWSDNPALCEADYMTGGSLFFDQATPNTRLAGKRPVPWSRMELAVLAASANECDESVSGASAPPSGAQKRYTCNTVISCAEAKADGLGRIESTYFGRAVYVGGKYRVLAGRYDSPVHTITDDDLEGGWELVGGAEGKEVYNAVAAKFVDAARDRVETMSPFRTSSTYETADNGRKDRVIELTAVDDAYRVQRLTEIHKRASRDQQPVKLYGNRRLMKVAPEETLALDLVDMPSWANGKVFRAVEIETDLGNPPRSIITARIESPTRWDDLATADYLTVLTSTPTVAVESPTGPTGLSAVSVVNGIQFSWGMTNVPTDAQVELFEADSNDLSLATMIYAGRASSKLITKLDTTTRYYWIQSRNSQGKTSATEPPGSTAGLPAQALAGSSALNAIVAPTTATKVGTTSTITTATLAVSAFGGTAPYTYSTTFTSGGSGISILNGSTNAPSFQATGMAVDETRTGTARVRVTDNVAATFDVTVPVTIARVDTN